MTEEETSVADDVEEAVSVLSNDEDNGSQEIEEQQEVEKRVPLSALEAERKRRQEAEKQSYLYQQQMAMQQSASSNKQDDEDDYTKSIKNWTQSQIKEQSQKLLEENFVHSNPGILERLQNDLPELYRKRPELKAAVMASPNRVLAAVQFLDDYAPIKSDTSMTRKKIEQNQMKPKSPHGSGKSAKLSKGDMIAKMSSEEFHQYRKEVMGQR